MICELFAVPARVAHELVATPARVHEVLAALDAAGAGVSLEKSWHGLHFALTGSAWDGDPPLNFIVAGGDVVGTEDVGYGPARVLHVEGVAALDAALGGFTDQMFARRFDPTALAANEIYPQIWDEPWPDLLDEYLDYLSNAKELVGKAARNGDAILIVIR